MGKRVLNEGYQAKNSKTAGYQPSGEKRGYQATSDTSNSQGVPPKGGSTLHMKSEEKES